VSFYFGVCPRVCFFFYFCMDLRVFLIAAVAGGGGGREEVVLCQNSCESLLIY